ncbi:hypothetical protein LPJ71_005842 [Coemansia sp. S17]|nr:hypothetical protein LPJ71_005842 [Coemansia sp. S17]
MNTLEFVVDNNAQIHTKYVIIHAHYADIVNGLALHIMNSPLLRDKMFPNVNSIMLILSVRDIATFPHGPECNINIMNYAIRLNQLFPKASSCHLEGDRFHTNAGQANVAGFELLVASLLVNRKEIIYRALDGFVLDNFLATSKLTKISHRETNDSDLFAQLISLNSSTLVELDFEFYNQSFLGDIVRTDDGATIYYPSLKRLRLFYRGSRVEEPELQLDGAPFPALVVLKLFEVAGISSDTLFKSNHLTLEYIDIVATVNEYQFLSSAGGDVQIKLPKLKYVNLYLFYNGNPSQLDAEHRLLEFAINSGPNVQRMKLDLAHCFDKDNLVNRLCSSSAARHLVFLEIINLDFSILDVISILKCTPNLTYLALQPPEEKSTQARETLEYVVDDKRLAHFYRTYRMDKSKLAVVAFENCSDPTISAHFGQMLGILCPKMSTVRWRGHMPFFESTYRLVCCLSAYSGFKERLQEIVWTEREVHK